MKSDAPHILLINPWIHDFAAYDFWAKPLGFLFIAGMLRAGGVNVSYIDCLDRFHPREPKTNSARRYGRGPYRKVRIETPQAVKDVPRTFSRYGVKPEWFLEDLKAVRRPDLILTTCIMTYWYSGLQETIRWVRKIFPDVPIVLGGVYPTLLPDHAAGQSGADEIVSGPGEGVLPGIIARYTGFDLNKKFDPENMDGFPYPAFDLQHHIAYAPFLTSTGCPFRCAYCASHILAPVRRFRSPESVVAELQYWRNCHGVTDFVLYDDAFLIDPERRAVPLMERIIEAELDIRFHTPNALHIKAITQKAAKLMNLAGFKTIRLGLETASFADRERLDMKVTRESFERGVKNLKNAGFQKEQIGAYLLAGLPGQNTAAVAESVGIVKQSGITPVIAHYSPIPHTALWGDAVKYSRYDLKSDPIYTNNAIDPCNPRPFNWKAVSELKTLTTS